MDYFNGQELYELMTYIDNAGCFRVKLEMTGHAKSGLPLKKFFNTSGLLYKSMQLKEKLPEMNDEEQDFVLVGFREADWGEKV